MRHRMGELMLILSSLAAAGCGSHEQTFAQLAEEFVYTTLSFTPATATSTGLHRYKGQDLDEQLDDMSPAAIDRHRRYFDTFRQRLQARVKREDLPLESRADYDIIQDQISLALLEYQDIQSPLHNPTVYVETAGNALFGPFVLNYAPLGVRMRHIIARLQKLPLFFDEALNNLASSPPVWTRVAAEENEGNLELIDKTIRAAVPTDQRLDYDRAAGPALAALRVFQNFLTKELMMRDTYDWRLGADRYTRKFRYTLASGADPAVVLETAERELEAVRARMLETALPLDRQFFPGRQRAAGEAGPERANQIIGEVLSHISARHSTRESYVEDAKRDLDEARQFVAQKHLLTLPARSNLQVIPTPEFMRGIYAVGGFNPAPALEPQLGAYYWITPIPADWRAERVESKLREYNFYKLKLLTIHEAMPGHYVQFEYANDIQPAYRRLLRAVYGNGPYIEGWAQYATQTMLDEGLLNHSPELRLTFQKEELRVIANAILDIRLQMLNMSDQEALDLMEKQTFQETEEATAKVQRAKLSSAQLPTYFVGWRGWIQVREQCRQAKGSAFHLAEFHNAALRQGAVPLPVLSDLLAAQAP